ncbi:MAG: LysE family translocator [Actinobacteria bacterium]|nr:MAG: LysE family translocator [Actinomycetota bacterium]
MRTRRRPCRSRASRLQPTPRDRLARVPAFSTYAVFLTTAIVLLLVPGPAVLYVVTRRSGGLASVAGITTGTVAYAALAAAGLSSLILASTVAFDVVKYAGAAYLFLLGVRRLLGRGLERPGEEAVPRTRRRAYTQGVVVNLTNPKTVVFVFAFLPQFVDPDAHHPWLQVIVLGLSFALLGFLSDSMYALAAGTVADRLRGSAGIARVQRWFGGGVLVGLGILAAVWTPSRAR